MKGRIRSFPYPVFPHALTASLSPAPASVLIFRFCFWRVTTWDLEGFQSPRHPKEVVPCDVECMSPEGALGQVAGNQIWAGGDSALRSWVGLGALELSVGGALACEGL